jgi:CHAT domain-containing protein
MADLAIRRNDLVAADISARRVVELTERFRAAAVSLESRSLGFGTLAPAYERAIEVTMRRAEQGDADAVSRALTLNEQALARGLLDRVLEGRLDRTARVPKALADERSQVRERWRARLAELDVAMRKHPDADATRALIDETAAAIQALLDRDTVLLEYGLGDVRSYLWVVSASDVTSFTLAPRAQIEALARAVHEGLAHAPGAIGTGRTLADRRELSRLVIAPAASRIAGKRLVLVLSGALSLVPFGALPVPHDAGRNGPDGPLLSTRHEIVQVPSATILGSMRALMSGRSRPAKTAVVFADPVYDAGDPRVHVSSASVPARAGSQRQDAAILARLPFSRGEAEAIASLAPGRVVAFLGAEATRERVLGGALSDYRFVHFATHGILNQQLPSLSSLAFSLVDPAGRPRDGLLRLPDIYDMTLNADVVVLSGCQTALGKNVRGEGLIGLARAFMYAGAPRVVASLWQVDDLATAELMKRFYRGMLVGRLTPAAALHRAQRELASSNRWSAPYFWAGFVLEGDWR